MKVILLLFCALAQAVIAQAAEPISVMTFNIRYGTAPDGENAWPHRRELALQVIKDSAPQILGLQEALREQLGEILEEFPQYASIGVGRETDGAGEYSPILYDRTRFDVLAAETFWLSDTPEVRASKNWGNNITRVCTWVRLVDRASNRVVRIYNTHWDHESQPAREKSGELLAQRIGEAVPNEPVIVMGDFNAGPTNPARIPFVEIGLRDSYLDIHSEQEDRGTFHAFSGRSNSGKIDAVLINDQWEVVEAEIMTTNRDGKYPSDHYPVTATLELKAK